MKMKVNIIKTRIKGSFSPFIWLVNFFVPKNKKYIIFYSEPEFSDNSKAVFEKMLELNYHEKYKFIWSVTKPSNYAELTEYALFVKHKSIKDFWYFARSKYIFTTHSFWVNRYIKERQVFINLWHGMPLKRIGLLEQGITKTSFANYNLMPVSSDLFRIIMSKCFGSNLQKNFISGLPRNDCLFKGKDILSAMGIHESYEKIILWMPTFRGSDNRKTDGTESENGLPVLNCKELIFLNEHLESKNILLILKLHPYQQKKIKSKDMKNILVLNDAQIPLSYHLYNIVGVADCLLTDYSSVYIDYLTLNRPIGFVYDDLDEYSKTRGFIFQDIKEYMPGVHIKTFDELLEFINRLSTNVDHYFNERIKIGEIFNKYNDGNNSLRLIDCLEELYFKEKEYK